MVKLKGLDTKISASVPFHCSPLNSVTPALLPTLHQDHSSICVTETEMKYWVSLKVNENYFILYNKNEITLNAKETSTIF